METMIKKTSRTIAGIVRLLMKRLPLIALYTGSLLVIYLTAQVAYTAIDRRDVEAAPVSNYLKYTSFIVNNFREGEDFTYTVCREFVGNYHATGKRTIYLVPQGKTTKERVFLTSKSFDGSIEGDACQSYIVRDSTYHLAVGSYQLGITTDIPVQYGIMKHTSVDSNVFTVREQSAGSNDYQAQINNLSAQIEDLKRQLGLPSASGSSTVGPAKSGSSSGTQVASSSPASSASPKPSASPTPSQLSGIPLVTPLLNGIGKFLGF